MADTLNIFGTEYTGVTGIIAKDNNSNDKTYIRPQGAISITANGNNIDVAQYSTANVSVSGGSPTLQTKSKTYTPTTSQQTDTINYDTGYDGLEKVNITVSAMPSGTAGTPTATKGTVSNHAISVTPSVTNTTGYITGGTKTGTAVSVSASEVCSGNLPITSNGNDIDCTNYATVSVNVSGTSKNVQVLQSTSRTNSSSLTKVLGDLTVSKTGTYDIYWSGGRTNTSTSYTWGTRLYVDGSGYGTENTTWSNNCQSNHLSNVSLTANQKLSVYARGRTGSYYTFAPMLTIVEV